MAGWSLNEGELIEENSIEDDEYWRLFNCFFSNSSWKRTAYKFGLVKSILDNLFNTEQIGNRFFISYDDIFVRFTENYWNLIVKDNLKLMRKGSFSNTSKIETILLDHKTESPILEKLEFSDISTPEKEAIIKEVKKACKRNVFGALYEDFEGKLYSFSLKGKGIHLSDGSYRFLFKYKPEIEIMNYYYWAKFLEQINDSAKVHILSKLELSTPKRNNLSIYKDLLMELDGHKCFYCGKELKETVHVDHFIPWSFIHDDKIWNFVLSCPNCNSKKNNKLPSTVYIEKIKDRNVIISQFETTKKDFVSYRPDLIEDMWTYARKSGYKEWIPKKITH